MRAISLKLILLSSITVQTANATDWSFSHDYVTLKSTDTESVYGVTVKSNLTKAATGFLKKTVTTSNGSYAPTPGSEIFGLEVPGLFYLQNPTLTGGVETQSIYSVKSGSCPTADRSGVFVFGQFDRYGRNDMTQNSQPVIGRFTYDHATKTSTVQSVYNVSNYGAVPGFSPFSVTFGACSNGVMTSAGLGDRGGSLYMTEEGGAYFRTNADHGIVVVPQVKLASNHMLAGNYAVFRHDSALTENIKNMRVSVDIRGIGYEGNALTDPEDSGSKDGSYADTFTITSVNSPEDGMLKGTLQHNGGGAVNLACVVYFTTQNVLFCAGQTPGAAASPLNLMLVSDATIFNAYDIYGVDISNDGMVRAIVPDGAGDLYVGGNFGNLDGVEFSGIARLNADGTLDTAFDYDESGGFDVRRVNRMIYYGGQLTVAGAWTTYSGTNTPLLARFNTDGTRDTSFYKTGTRLNTQGAGTDALEAYAMVMGTTAGVDTDKFYVGGTFNKYGSTTVDYLVRLNADGTRDTSFSVGGLTNASGDHVRALGIGVTTGTDEGYLYVAGQFSKYGGTNRKNILRLTTGGALDTGFNTTGTGLNGLIRELAVDGNTIWVSGDFTSYNGTARNGIARLTLTGALDTSFDPGSGITGGNPDIITKLLPFSGGLLIAGDFTSYNGTTARGIALLASSGAVDSSFDSGYGALDDIYISAAKVHTIYHDTGNSHLYLGGHMAIYDKSPVRGLARVLETGAIDDYRIGGGIAGYNYNSGFPMLIDSNNRITFGNAEFYRGVYLGDIGRVTASGAVDMSFNASYAGVPEMGFDGSVSKLQWDSAGRILVSGDFNNYNGTSRRAVARLSAEGVLDTSFAQTGSGLQGGGAQYVIEEPNSGKIYVGGWFTSYDGTTANGLARLNADGSLDTAFATAIGLGFTEDVGGSSPGDVWMIQVDASGNVYVGGDFNYFNGVAAPFLVRLTSAGALDTSFNIGSGFLHNGDPNDTYITSLRLTDDGLFVGGRFNSFNGNNTLADQNFLRLTTTGARDTTFNNDVVQGEIYDIAIADDGKVYVSGYLYYDLVLRLNTDGSHDTAFAPDWNTGGYVWSLALDAFGNLYVGGDLRGVGSNPYNGIVRLSTVDGSRN